MASETVCNLEFVSLVIELNVLYSATVFELESDQM